MIIRMRFTATEIVFKEIQHDDELIFTKNNNYPLAEKTNVELQLVPEGHADWAFKVKPKPTMEPGKSIYVASGKYLAGRLKAISNLPS